MNLNAEQLAVLVRTLSQEEGEAGQEKRRVPRESQPGTLTITLCQQPLQAADALGHGPADICAQAAVRIANLSSRGIALIHDRPLEPGQRFIIHLPRQIDHHVNILCTVVHCTSSGASLYNIGAEFTGIVPAEAPSRGRMVACA